MAESGNTISLQSKFVFTFKTIATVFFTLGSMLWGYHQFVLSPQLQHLEHDVESVEGKIDKVYDHMIGIGGAQENVESAEKPTETTDSQGTL